MSKRNFILLVIILAVVIIAVFIILFLRQPKTETVGTTEGTNFLADFLPFGKSKTSVPAGTTAPADISGTAPAAGTEISSAKLRKVSSFPVAGYGVFMKERFKEIQNPSQTLPKGEGNPIQSPPSGEAGGGITEFTPALRYVDKSTGNIYQTFADKIDERKFSATVIPEVREAFFGNNGSSVVMRYLKENPSTREKIIETFVGALPKEYPGADSVGTDEIKGSFLPENISDASVAPDGSKLFYLFGIGDGSAGVTFSFQNNAKVQVFDSPFTEWLSFWASNKMITLTTKPSANVPGFMYAVNPDRKDFNKILGGINGLTTLASPDGKMVLYADSNLSLSVLDISTGDSGPLGMRTLPEKCVWTGASDSVFYCAVPKFTSPADYPDSWYQGEISFSDEIWKIDARGGGATMVADPVSVVGEEADGIKLSLDENQDYLFFVNKKDSYLWELQLK